MSNVDVRRIVEIAAASEGAVMDHRLLEWYHLAERKCSLELQLSNGRQISGNGACSGDHVRYSEDESSHSLRRRLHLMRLRERTIQLIEIANREVSIEQGKIKKELNEISKMLNETEAKIKLQARKPLTDEIIFKKT